MKAYQLIKTEQKALEINLNDKIYGTFAEIGAGQEVARNFFQAGAASATIAKTMSAYDKTYSDAIYGMESTGRYVCESRLYKMLDHEWQLLIERLDKVKPDNTFFVFADTVSAINFAKTNKGHGWLGLRFQLHPDTLPNDIVIHVKMYDNDNKLQQDAIGILGVNLLYAAYYYHHDIEALVRSLHDGVADRASIDLIQLHGPDFAQLDNRMLAFYMIKYKLSEVTMLDSCKEAIHASEFLYKKSLMVVRGRFKPTTKVTKDVITSSFNQFLTDEKIEKSEASLVTEITFDHLREENGEVHLEDFLHRTELMMALGHKVMLTQCPNHQMLINYLSDYKIKHLGLVIGVNELLEIINEKYYHNQDGRLLVAFGELFTRNIRIYAYPAMRSDIGLLTAKSLPVPAGITFLYKYLLESNQIVEVKQYNESLLNIFSAEVLDQIQSGNDNWKEAIPAELIDIVISHKLFGYSQ